MKDDNKTRKQLVDELMELRLQNVALKESESAEKYRSLVENLRDVIYELDSQGVVLYISPAVRDMLGFDSTEIVGKRFIDLAYKDDLDLATEWFSELSKGTEKPCNYRVLNKSGEFRWAQTKTRPVIEGGVFKGAHGILIDVTAQRRAEEALRKGLEKYRWVLDNMADVITVMDMNLRFTYVSPSIMRMRGYTAEEAMAQTFEQVMKPESLQISANVFEEEMKLEASGTADPDRIRIVEVEQYKKDGSIVLMENHLSFLRDEAKKPVGIISVSHDITERRRAEEALKKAKTLLDKTFDSLEEAIFIVESHTRTIIACNHATEVIFGFGEKDLMGCSTAVLHVDKLSYDLFGQELFPALDANGVFRTEFQMRRRDGSVFPTEHTVTEILDDSGRRNSIVSVVRDMTDRRMAEKKLKQTNIFLDSIIENIPNMIFLKDAVDLRFIRLNRAGEDLVGYSRDDLLGKNDYDFFPKEQADHFTKKDREVLNGKKVLDIPEESLQTRTRGERTLHTKKVPLLDEKGEPEFLLGISEDITDRKKMEETLRESEELFRSYLEYAPDGVYMSDLEGNFLYGNLKCEAIIGYRREELIGKNFLELNILPEQSLNKSDQLLQANIEGKSTGPDEIELISKEGRLIPVEINTSVVQRLGQRIVLAFVRDITERKQREKERTQRESILEKIFDVLPIGLWFADRDGKLLRGNPAGVKIWGAEPKVNRAQYGIFRARRLPSGEEIAPEDWSLAHTVREGVTVLDEMLEIDAFDGKKKVILNYTAPVLDDRGAVEGAIIVNVDITRRKEIEEQLLHTLESLRKSFSATVQVLVSAVETRDPYTAGHQIRSADLARAIATKLGLPQERIDGIRMAGAIHDIGKLSIPAEILSKPTKLKNIEFSLIKEHSLKGYEMLKDVESPWPLAQIVYQHHERMDGSGYPRNLKDDEILMEARILAVADVVESMASHRPYRPALGIDAALEEIARNRATHYDSEVVDACLRIFNEEGYKFD